LRDESERLKYDLIYPSIIRRRTSPQSTPTPCPPPASTPQSEALSEEAQIAAIQKSKQGRSARWQTQKTAFDSSIFELQRGIRRLEQEIKNLDSISAAEAAEDAQKNSWGTWLLSQISKKREESEEEKARKDRERQERRIEKDMKERRLESKMGDLKREQNRLTRAKEEIDAADLGDDTTIRMIQAKIRAREYRKMQERMEKQREKAAEAARKQQAEERAAEQKRHDEAKKRREQYQNAHPNFTGGTTHQASASTCGHGGWWPKVQGRAACPECYESWTYLLQCPGCRMKACPKCQAAIRPRRPHGAAWTKANPDLGYDSSW